MDDQLWTVKANFSSNIVLANTETLSSPRKPHPCVRNLVLTPRLNDRHQQTGNFDIAIDFVLDNVGTLDSVNELAADVGREILDYYLGLLLFLCGDSVTLIAPPSFTYRDPGSNKGKTIICGEQGDVPPPFVLPVSSLAAPLNPKHTRILSYFRQAVGNTDIPDSVMLFLVALEILANQFEVTVERTRKCEKCGHETHLGPTVRERVQHLLVNVLHFSTADFEEVWTVRNQLFHGGVPLLAKDLRRLHGVRERVRVAVLRGMKHLLGLKDTEPPYETRRLGITDAKLVVHWEDKQPPS